MPRPRMCGPILYEHLDYGARPNVDWIHRRLAKSYRSLDQVDEHMADANVLPTVSETKVPFLGLQDLTERSAGHELNHRGGL